MRAWRHGGGIGTPRPFPPPPPVLDVTCDAGEVRLDWSPTSPNPATWTIERSHEGAPYVVMDTIAGSEVVWFDPEVTCPGPDDFCYRIRGIYSGTPGDYTVPACTTAEFP
jgi:hypothetical protein